jgi:hypothetical protein
VSGPDLVTICCINQDFSWFELKALYKQHRVLQEERSVLWEFIVSAIV